LDALHEWVGDQRSIKPIRGGDDFERETCGVVPAHGKLLRNFFGRKNLLGFHKPRGWFENQILRA